MNSFANPRAAMQAYRSTGASSEADPHHVVQMLMQGALDRLAAAKGHMQRGETIPKGESLSKAVNIISALRGALDRTQGGEIAERLESLYEYSEARILEANVKNDAAPLDEVTRLLTEVKEAWDAIRPRTAP